MRRIAWMPSCGDWRSPATPRPRWRRRYSPTMSDLGSVTDVTGWILEEDEQLGARDKVWLREDASDAAGWWLFKEPRSRGLPELGADLWAEAIASAVTPLVAVPSVEVRFALSGQRPGIVSRKVDGTLVHGNELLWLRNSEYAREQRGPVTDTTSTRSPKCWTAMPEVRQG